MNQFRGDDEYWDWCRDTLRSYPNTSSLFDTFRALNIPVAVGVERGGGVADVSRIPMGYRIRLDWELVDLAKLIERVIYQPILKERPVKSRIDRLLLRRRGAAADETEPKKYFVAAVDFLFAHELSHIIAGHFEFSSETRCFDGAALRRSCGGGDEITRAAMELHADRGAVWLLGFANGVSKAETAAKDSKAKSTENLVVSLTGAFCALLFLAESGVSWPRPGDRLDLVNRSYPTNTLSERDHFRVANRITRSESWKCYSLNRFEKLCSIRRYLELSKMGMKIGEIEKKVGTFTSRFYSLLGVED